MGRFNLGGQGEYWQKVAPPKESVVNSIARLGVMGAVVLMVTATVCGLAVYCVVNGVDKETTEQLVGVLTSATTVGMIAAAARFFGNSGTGT